MSVIGLQNYQLQKSGLTGLQSCPHELHSVQACIEYAVDWTYSFATYYLLFIYYVLLKLDFVKSIDKEFEYLEFLKLQI